MDLFYDPPYYAFWANETPDEVQAARQWLKDLIARSGPYDGVMMFSQGCMLASSSLLLQAAHEPGSPPLFKAAIFICGGPSLHTAESVGYHISPEMRERDEQSRDALDKQADVEAILAQGSERWGGADYINGKSEEQLREEFQGPCKISIPTAHIYGDKDPRYPAGVMLSAVCDPAKRKTYNHEGGHEIPRKDAVSRRIAMLVRWALEQGKSSG